MTDIGDIDVMMRWLTELAGPDPDPVVVASLEADAEEHGWHPYDGLLALGGVFGKLKKAVGRWDPDLHPRGKDGTFIEAGGEVRLEGEIDLPNGKKFDATGMRGTVDSIIPNRDNPGHPTVRVKVSSPDGTRSALVDVTPDHLTAAPEKARLDRPVNRERDVTPEARPARPAPPPETPEQRQQREAAKAVRTIPDDELAASLGDADGVWRQAIEREQANRADKRAADAARRQALIDDINAKAAELSTTDVDLRAQQLDDLLAKLRFSIIDTDKVHDNVYPPGESGRWTPERHAQHEEMWNDLLSQVQSMGVPQDRDALVLGGLPGAGKSFMLRPGQKAEGFGVVSWEPGTPIPDGVTHVSVNPDIVKEMLIARGMLPEGISTDLKPMEQVTFLHEESSYVAKMFSQRLGDLGYNVVLDNTMDSEGGMLKRMTPLARQGYKFRGIFADIPVDESKASAAKRYKDAALSEIGGRFVPSSVQGNRGSSKGNLSKNRDAMDSLVAQDWFTQWMIVDNTGVSQRTPKGEIVGQGTGGGTAADRYRPGNEAAVPKAGPQLPTPPVPPPTIEPGAAPATAPAPAV